MLLKFAANFTQQFSCSILTDIMNGRRNQRAGAYFPEQMEFSIPGGIKSSEIVGAYKKQGGEIVGDFIPNLNFGGN